MTRNPAPAAASAPTVPAVDLAGLPGVRCLGGLVTGDGATTLPGRVFRGPAHALLGPGSAAALRALGVTTVVDLRGAGEGEVAELDATRLARPVEDQDDAEFRAAFGPDLGSPRYYAEVVRRWPGLLVAALRSVAEAPAGGVLVHCAAGRDRTGQVAALLLTAVGVPAETVADRDAQARRDANAFLRAHPRPHEVALDGAALESALHGARGELLDFLRGDPLAALRAAGLTAADVAGLRGRLLGAGPLRRARARG